MGYNEEEVKIKNMQNKFTRDKEVRSIIQDPFTREEIINIMIEKKPASIYCLPYNEKTPYINIDKISNEGVWISVSAFADKTIEFYSWQRFIALLVLSGLENFRF